MKTYLDCIPCFFKQALHAARISGANPKTQKIILDELAKIFPSFPLSSSPPEMGKIIYNIVTKITKKNDPYYEIKEKSNNLALDIYDKLKNKVNNAHNRLATAVELAIAGNIIDYGAKNFLDVNAELKKILKIEHKSITSTNKDIYDLEKFIGFLSKSKNILYLADNAGETVFDKILIEEIKKSDNTKKIIYAVKEKPIINDATATDAYTCGIDETAKIISSGSDAPGTVLSLCSDEFMNIFKKADMVISKGQGNFEALSEVKRSIFFLLMVKCPVIAQSISSHISNCRLGDMALLCFEDENHG
ncbi:DUF89 family protein [bacterium]|nr:DUF89 family protein [bacterium]